MQNDFDTRILQATKRKGRISAAQLGKELGISRTNLYYHLNSLVADKLLQKEWEGRNVYYHIAPDYVLAEYYDKLISNIEDVKKDLTEANIINQASSEIRRGGCKPKPRLVIINYLDLLPETLEKLNTHYQIIDYSSKELLLEEEEFVARASGAEVVVANYPCRVSGEMLDQLPELRYIHTTTFMHTYIDSNSLKKSGRHLSHLPFSYKSTALAEYLLAQTFALLRPTTVAAEQVKAGIREFRGFRGEQLQGKKVGIIGTDFISADLVRIFRGFGLEVKIFSNNSGERADRFGVTKFYPYKEVIKSSDILYFASRANKNTNTLDLDDYFVDYLTKPTYIVSVSKHLNVDYEALRRGMLEGVIKGMAFDHIGELFDSAGFEVDKSAGVGRIMYLPNVLLTPDISWYTTDSVISLNEYTIDALQAYASGDDQYLLF